MTNAEKSRFRNPIPTVDIIIETKNERGEEGIILIQRKNPPYGWALPGGFVDYGESLEKAAVREAKEETSLDVRLKYQLHTYSEPDRDPRLHTISTVYVAEASGTPKARDDARDLAVFTPEEIAFPLAFDHRRILDDYFRHKRFSVRTQKTVVKKDCANMMKEPPGDENGTENKEAGKPEPLRDMKLKEVIRVWGGTEADVIKSFLESQGIPCLLQGRIIQSIYPFSTDGLGEIKILVPEDDYDTAKKLLEERE